MNRRSFLKIAFTAAAISAIPIELAEAIERRIPVVYGDAVHDDWAALQAALNGEDFTCDDGLFASIDPTGCIVIRDAYFILSKTLVLNGTTRTHMIDCHFEFAADPYLVIKNASENGGRTFSYCHFISAPGHIADIGIQVLR